MDPRPSPHPTAPGAVPPAAPATAPATTRAALLTGERTAPDVPDERYWFERHVVAYELAAARVAALAEDAGARLTVLDAGCGEGYGLAALAEAGATRVIGVDYDAATIDHAHATYAAADARIEVHRAELLTLPLADDEVDLTVSFQVIEHVYDVPGYLRSLARVTRPGGELLVATPNRLTFTPDHDTPVNPFHVREFTATELTAELTAVGLEVVEVVGVHHGPELQAAQRQLGARLTDLLAAEPHTWSAQLRRLVHDVDTSCFEVRGDDLDGSLDLIARCRTGASHARTPADGR